MPRGGRCIDATGADPVARRAGHRSGRIIQTRETISLVMIEGVECQMTGPRRLAGRRRLPANVTAAGKVLVLSAITDQELREYFPQGLAALTPSTRSDWPDFGAQLAECARMATPSAAVRANPGCTQSPCLSMIAPARRLSSRAAAGRVPTPHASVQAITRAYGS